MRLSSVRPVTRGSVRAFVGLGSNQGGPEANLRAALDRLALLPETRVERVSQFRRSEPWGDPDQPEFCNAVAELCTALPPDALLTAFKQIEREMGRKPGRRWGPRLIDLDLLVYGAERRNTPELTVPHPWILDRPFVWEPLQEIAPEIVEDLRRAAVSLRGAGPEGEQGGRRDAGPG